MTVKVDELRNAVEKAMPASPTDETTSLLVAAIKAAVRAAVPGKQQQKNLEPLLAAAYKAAARSLRRNAGRFD